MLEIFYHPIYSYIILGLNSENRCGFFIVVSKECIHSIQITFKKVNARSHINIWDDKEFQALSKYIIAFLKR